MKYMKKNLLSLTLILLSSLAALTGNAAPFWYDVITNLPLGCITTNAPSVNLTVTNFSNWYPHGPGSTFAGTPYDMLIINRTNFFTGTINPARRLIVNGLNSEYIMRLFDPVTTNGYSSGSLYASFIVNAN